MDYLKLYKKRVSSSGKSGLSARMNDSVNQADSNITQVAGHEDAVLNGDEKIDIVVETTKSALNKYLHLRPSSKVRSGDYISYVNDIGEVETYIVRQVNRGKINPIADAFLCNQVINFKGLKEPIPCYLNNSTYGSKGLSDIEKGNEMDSKTKIYVQRSVWTDKFDLGKRIMFNNRFVYKISEFEDTVWAGMYVIVCQRDESNVMDDFENNIAWNDEYANDDNVENEITINGSERIKIGVSETYTSNSPVEWCIDGLDSVSIIEQTETTIVLKGVKQNWVTLSALSKDETKTLDIMVYK